MIMRLIGSRSGKAGPPVSAPFARCALRLPLVLFVFACTEDPSMIPDGGGSLDARPDATAKDGTPDAGGPDADPMDADPMDAEPVDAAAADAEPGDADLPDGTTTPCSQLQRDVCLATVGCVLDGSEIAGSGYYCRDAISDCERIKDGNVCMANSACVHDPGACYCAEGNQCLCGGGPPPVCRDACGNGVECPTTDYFCELSMDDGDPNTICIGDVGQAGVCTPIPPTCVNAGGGPTCGCAANTATTTYTNDCERRLARAAFAQTGACP
jgi:hypothetical protein